jgi:hypothetical protein
MVQRRKYRSLFTRALFVTEMRSGMRRLGPLRRRRRRAALRRRLRPMVTMMGGSG